MQKRNWLVIGGVAALALVLFVFSRTMVGRSNLSGAIGKSDLGTSVHTEQAYFADTMAAPSAPMAMGGMVEVEGQNSLVARKVRSTAVDVRDEDQQEGQDRLVIKSGQMTMVVPNVRQGIEAIRNYAIQKDGFVVTSNVDEHSVNVTGFITVRIPVDVFDKGIEEIQAFGEVKSQTVNGQDVTEEFVDLTAQVENLEVAERQFQEIMARAVKIEDVLAVQRELTQVRGQIDRIEGRRKFLSESASMSMLTVHLSTDPDELPVIEDDNRWKPWATVKESVRDLLFELRHLGDNIIQLIVFIPLILVYVLGAWLMYRAGKWALHRLKGVRYGKVEKNKKS